MGPSPTRAWCCWLLAGALLSSCSLASRDPALIEDGEVAFVRDGLLVPSTSEGRQLGAFSLLDRPWSPGEVLSVGGLELTAPLVPECLPVYSVPLGDVSRLVALGGTAPDTAMAWSPDGSLLAVGSYRGEILVLDGWSGEVRSRRRLAETMVKQVAWAPNGETLYAGEQSPDAFLHALDPIGLKTRWTRRLADEVGSSPAPDGEDLYGVYTLPAAYALEVLPGGDLLVGATHAWNDEGGTRRNLARLLRLDPEGDTLAAWPTEAAAPVTLSRFRTDVPGGLVVLSVGGSSTEEVADDIPRGGVQVLELSSLSPRAAFVPEPLAPHYSSTFIWEALDVDAGHGKVLAGLADGRVFLWDLAGGPPRMLEVGTPLLAADVPIASSVGFGFFTRGGFVLATSGTTIPYGSSSTAARPPSAHPAENRLFLHGLDGSLLGTWQGPQQLNGLHPVTEGDDLLAGGGLRKTDSREDSFGALLFERDDESPALGGAPVTCPTAGPVFFRLAHAADGRIAVAEHPWVLPDGSQAGAYRITVLR